MRTALSVHPRLTEQQSAAIGIDPSTDVTEQCHCRRPDRFCVARPGVPETVEVSVARAGSGNPLLRRRAAADPRLPADTVARLAVDRDLGVRVLLGWCQPAAPAEQLLRAFADYRGCGRDRLVAHPDFPTYGLARFADDPDPALRALTARDPGADPAVIARLADDPDDAVRRSMAGCPRLPVARIVALLGDADLAGTAAANPALPVEVMERILNEAGHRTADAER